MSGLGKCEYGVCPNDAVTIVDREPRRQGRKNVPRIKVCPHHRDLVDRNHAEAEARRQSGR